MGVFDNVCGIQIKCTPDPILKKYEIGDRIELKKGIYIGYEGWFSVEKRKVTNSGKNIYTKWGDRIDIYQLIENYGIIEKLCNKHIGHEEIFKIHDFIDQLRKNNLKED